MKYLWVVILILFAPTMLFATNYYEYIPKTITSWRRGTVGVFVHVEEEFNVASAFNDRETEGQFFLLGGYIGETEYIYTFIEVAGGTYTRMQMIAKDVYIHENSYLSPRVLILKYRNRKRFSIGVWEDRYLLIVPEGTIIKTFEIK